MQPIRITAVSYLNTKPFIYGLFRSELAGELDLSLDIPSVCARKLLTGEADLALAPVAVIPELDQACLVSDYCIGAVGPVKTVALFSELPIDKIRRIYLDFHSRTSIALVQVLCRNYWRITPEFMPATEGFEQQIGGQTAAVIIGDRTISMHGRFPYVYDMGEAWTAWTGLPFVFAAWVSRKPLDPDFIERFNHALMAGLDRLPELIKILPSIPGFDLQEYYSRYISYPLDDQKWKGLRHFLDLLAGPDGYRLSRRDSFLAAEKVELI